MKFWTQRDGTKIAIRDMTDAHIKNAIAMLERMTEDRRDTCLSSYPCFQGEMAQYYAEQDWNRTASAPVEELAEQTFPVYADLVEEQDRRLSKPRRVK